MPQHCASVLNTFPILLSCLFCLPVEQVEVVARGLPKEDIHPTLAAKVLATALEALCASVLQHSLCNTVSQSPLFCLPLVSMKLGQRDP